MEMTTKKTISNKQILSKLKKNNIALFLALLFHEAAPAIKIKSTVGAGDSMVAGIIIALQKKLSWRDVLRYGVAAGTAATMNAGTELCTRENVEKVRAFFQ